MALRNMVLPHPLVSQKIIIHSLYKKNMYIYIYVYIIFIYSIYIIEIHRSSIRLYTDTNNYTIHPIVSHPSCQRPPMSYVLRHIPIYTFSIVQKIIHIVL